MSQITVVFGGQSPEHDISILTGLQVERLFAKAGREVQSFYWDRLGRWHLVGHGSEARDYLDGPPKGSQPVELRFGEESGFYRRARMGARSVEVGTAFLCLHGGLGEGGGCQTLFELLGIPYTGGDVFASALGMDKLAFAGIARSAGLEVLPRVLMDSSAEPEFEGPYILKPRFGGSSIGIEVVEDLATARVLAKKSRHLRNGAVLEPFRSDLFDLNVAFKTYPEFKTSQIERPLRSAVGGIYSYAEKYLNGAGLSGSSREMPAVISADLSDQICACSERIAAITGLSGIVRVDFLSDGTALYLNEVNSIPGAMALYLWSGEDVIKLLSDSVVEAGQRQGVGFAGSDSSGEALRAAGGIAGKLAGLRSSSIAEA